jgi:short-subunit dehydrogenase
MFGDIAYPLFAAYSATKFGLRGWSDALRRELAPLNVGVTYVAPRATRTPAASRFDNLIEPFGMTLDDPAKVGENIVKGIERDARTVYPVGPERLFVLIQRLFPGIIDTVAVNQVKGVA